jgi:hypothetical protein
MKVICVNWGGGPELVNSFVFVIDIAAKCRR